MARLDRMKQNQKIIDVLGLKHISTSLKDSAQSNYAKGKRSRAGVVVDMIMYHLLVTMTMMMSHLIL